MELRIYFYQVLVPTLAMLSPGLVAELNAPRIL